MDEWELKGKIKICLELLTWFSSLIFKTKQNQITLTTYKSMGLAILTEVGLQKFVISESFVCYVYLSL